MGQQLIKSDCVVIMVLGGSCAIVQAVTRDGARAASPFTTTYGKCVKENMLVLVQFVVNCVQLWQDFMRNLVVFLENRRSVSSFAPRSHRNQLRVVNYVENNKNKCCSNYSTNSKSNNTITNDQSNSTSSHITTLRSQEIALQNPDYK